VYFRNDVGKPKAQCAAAFIEKRCRDVKVKWHMKKIQEFDDTFYRQFALVVAGLDNVKARLWLNSKLHSLITYDEDGDPEPESIIPLVDGGTEGFKGQARFFFGPFTSCFECSAADIKAGPKFELCTIATTPRIAEHCVAYALLVLWPLLTSFSSAKKYHMADTKTAKAKGGGGGGGEGGGVKLGKDDPEHMTWLYERAKERAAEFKIPGVTYNLTMQYVKNIIPAIASTNALVSAGLNMNPRPLLCLLSTDR
jgi:NEDD8-activating enzyme E1